MADTADLIEGLNEALAYEYQAVVMYTTYASTVSGIHRGELKAFFEGEVADEQNHAAYLADKVDALGGTPTTEPKPVQTPTDPRTMLEIVLESEEDAIERYGELMELAEEVGELGLANDLHDFISDETTHKEQTGKLLRGTWE
jgi:bacterioferritin